MALVLFVVLSYVLVTCMASSTQIMSSDASPGQVQASSDQPSGRLLVRDADVREILSDRYFGEISVMLSRFLQVLSCCVCSLCPCVPSFCAVCISSLHSSFPYGANEA